MKKIKYLTTEEQRRFFAEAQRNGARDEALFTLMLAYGMRVGEVLSLRLDDISFRENSIYIARLKGGDSLTHPLKTRVKRLLKHWLKERQRFANADSPYMFIPTRKGGERMSNEAVLMRMKQLCERAEIPPEKSHPHVLRHTTAVNLLDSGVDVFDVKLILGHRNIQNTMRYLEVSKGWSERRLRYISDRSSVFR